MATAARIAHSTIYQTAGKIAAVVLGTIQFLLIIHYFGDIGSGIYATVTAFLGIAVVLADLGLHIVNVTNLSKPGAAERKILSNAFTLREVSMMIIFGLAIVAGYFWLPSSPEVRLGIVFAGLSFAFLGVNQIFVGVFQKYLVNHMLVLGEIIAKTIVIAAVIILAKFGYGVLGVLLTLNLAFGIHLTLTMYFAYRLVPFGFAFNAAVWQNLLHQSWPLAFSGVLNLIYFKVDTVILESMHGAAAAGVYSLPYKILEVLIAFPVLFAGLLLPILSAAAVTNFDRFKNIIQHGFNVLLYIVCLIIAGTLAFSEPIIRIAAYDRFAELADSVMLLRLVLVAVGFLFIGNLFGHAIPALGLQKKMIWGYAVGAVVGLALYFTLIPKFSYYGAAIGTIITEAVVAFYATRLVFKRTDHKLKLNGLAKAILAASMTGLLSYWAADFIPLASWFGAVMVTLPLLATAAIFYIIVLYKLGGITRADLKLLIPDSHKRF